MGLIGQMPETFPVDTSQYSGGRNVPSSVVQDIRRQFLAKNHLQDYFPQSQTFVIQP